MKIRIIKVVNKRGKEWYELERRFLLFFWVDVRMFNFRAKHKFKTLKKAQKYIDKHYLLNKTITGFTSHSKPVTTIQHSTSIATQPPTI